MVDHLTLGEAGIRPEDLVEVGQPDAAPLDLDLGHRPMAHAWPSKQRVRRRNAAGDDIAGLLTLRTSMVILGVRVRADSGEGGAIHRERLRDSCRAPPE
jgi:hypothetical protein